MRKKAVFSCSCPFVRFVFSIFTRGRDAHATLVLPVEDPLTLLLPAMFCSEKAYCDAIFERSASRATILPTVSASDTKGSAESSTQAAKASASTA